MYLRTVFVRRILRLNKDNGDDDVLQVRMWVVIIIVVCSRTNPTLLHTIFTFIFFKFPILRREKADKGMKAFFFSFFFLHFYKCSARSFPIFCIDEFRTCNFYVHILYTFFSRTRAVKIADENYFPFFNT